MCYKEIFCYVIAASHFLLLFSMDIEYGKVTLVISTVLQIIALEYAMVQLSSATLVLPASTLIL